MPWSKRQAKVPENNLPAPERWLICEGISRGENHFEANLAEIVAVVTFEAYRIASLEVLRSDGEKTVRKVTTGPVARMGGKERARRV